MPARGRPWEELRASFREQCKANQEPCWLCKKPINYWAKAKTAESFSADHVTPTSLGGDPLRLANLRASHYQRLQLSSRQHHPGAVPHLPAMVTQVH